jgi:redox-sensitive bicupin YhaK (pirin superfamily)
MTADTSEQDETMVYRPADERGKTERDWLESYHTFSFGRHRDPNWTRWGPLRVMNEDYIDPNSGFSMHRHENMEILTYPVSGEITHEDSSGGEGVIRSGQIQRMTAGAGIRHSERNDSRTESLHLLQIWVLPEEKGLEPSYETVELSPPEEVRNRLDLIADPDADKGPVRIHQDVSLYRGHLEPDQKVHHEFKGDRVGWIQLISGRVEVGDLQLSAGDGVGIRPQSALDIRSSTSAHFLFFDMNGGN